MRTNKLTIREGKRLHLLVFGRVLPASDERFSFVERVYGASSVIPSFFSRSDWYGGEDEEVIVYSIHSDSQPSPVYGIWNEVKGRLDTILSLQLADLEAMRVNAYIDLFLSSGYESKEIRVDAIKGLLPYIGGAQGIDASLLIMQLLSEAELYRGGSAVEAITLSDVHKALFKTPLYY